MILVVVQAADAERVSEGLRAGVGLGLRGDQVTVLLTGPAARFADRAEDPRIERALRTLAELGRPARVADEGEVASWMAKAQAVEVWTSGSDPGSEPSSGSGAGAGAGAAPRRLRVGEREIEVWPGPPRFRAGGRAIDGADLVEQILDSDGPVVVR